MAKKIAVDSLVQSNFIPCIALHERSITFLIFKFVDLPEGASVSSSEELVNLLNTEFILPDGTVLDNEYTIKRTAENMDKRYMPGATLTVNSNMTYFISNHASSYSSQQQDDRIFRYSDFPKFELPFSSMYIQLSYLRRFSLARFDLDNNPKETNFIPRNSSFSYTINTDTLKLNLRQREPSYYDHDYYKAYSEEHNENMKTLSSPPIFHIYTEDEDIVDYRDAGFLVNYGFAGFWCNCEVDRIDVETARNNNSIFQSIESRIKIPQGEPDDHSS
jgi:hypothetical protein